MRDEQKVTFLGVVVWLLGMSYFFYEFFLAMFMGSIAKDIMTDLRLTAQQFSLLAGAYFYTYSVMQTPVGVLAGRYGARKVLTFAAAVCTIGTFWFALSHTFVSSFLARFVIGFGSSFSFISTLVIVMMWFPRRYFAFLAGFSQFIAGVGGLMAGGPLVLLIRHFHGDWRLVMLGVGCVGVLITIMIGTFARTSPKRSANEVIFLTSTIPFWTQIRQILSVKQVWGVFLYAGFNYVTLPLLGAYWGTLFLQSRGLSQGLSATTISMIWLGLATGCPIVGRLSDRMKRRKSIMVICAALGIVFSSLILYLPAVPLWLLFILFFFVGISSAGQNLTYATITEVVPHDVRATSLGVNNTASMIVSGIFPMFLGSFIGYLNNKMGVTGHHLSSEVYTIALSTIPIFYFLALISAAFGIKETFGRAQKEVHFVTPD